MALLLTDLSLQSMLSEEQEVRGAEESGRDHVLSAWVQGNG